MKPITLKRAMPIIAGRAMVQLRRFRASRSYCPFTPNDPFDEEDEDTDWEALCCGYDDGDKG